MATRIGNTTAGKFEANIIQRLKSYTDKDITTILWRDLINDKVNMINEVLSTKDKEVYKTNVDLVSSGLKGFSAVPAANNTLDVTRKLVHLASLAKYPGTVAADMVNAKVLLSLIDLGGDMEIHENEIESMTFPTSVTADIVLKNALDANFGTSLDIDDVTVIAVSPNTDENVQISLQTWYRYIDQIVSIYCTGNTEEAVMCKTLSEFFGIRKLVNYNYIDSIVWVREGEYIKFCKGSNVSTYGTRTMYYIRKPYEVAAPTDVIDVPPSNMDLLYKLCMIDALQTLKVSIPEELKSAESQIITMQNAKTKEITELLQKAPSN